MCNFCPKIRKFCRKIIFMGFRLTWWWYFPCILPRNVQDCDLKAENLRLFQNFTFYWPCIMQWFLVNDQRDAQIPFYVFIFIYNSLHVSSTMCSSSGETNCINKPLVTVTLCWWLCRVHLHTTQPPTPSDSYQRFYWYSFFLSWWWARCARNM